MNMFQTCKKIKIKDTLKRLTVLCERNETKGNGTLLNDELRSIA